MEKGSSLQGFLTSGVKLADSETLRRIKVLNVFLLVLALATPFVGLFYFYIGALFLFYTCIVTGLVGLLLIAILRMTKSPRLVGNLAVFVLWGTLALIRWYAGGMTSGGLILLTWVWNAVLILLAIFMTGYLWGTIWSSLVFIETGIAVSLFRSGRELTNLVPPDISPLYALGAYLAGLLAILLFAFLFEKARHDTLLREEEKSQALRESRRYIEDILQRSPVPTFVVDKNHRVVQWNRACHEMTGIPPEEILGRAVWEGFSLDEHGSLADRLLDSPDRLRMDFGESIVSMSESGSYALDTFLPKFKGGMRAVISTAPILDQDGTVKGAIQTIQGIGWSDGRVGKRAGASGWGNEDAFAYPIVHIDTTGRISRWNKAAQDLLGYEQSEILGKSPLVLVSKPYRQGFRDTVIRVFKGESFSSAEWRYQTKDGQPVYVLAKASPSRSPSGTIEGCLITHTDITELRLRMRVLERGAAESKERLKELLEEYNLLKKNIATFLRKKGEEEGEEG